MSDLRIQIQEAPELTQLLAGKAPVMLDAGTQSGLHALLCERLGLERTGRLALLTLGAGDRTMGCYVLGRFRSGQRFDPALVSELVVRVSWRLQAVHLMDCVLAPIGAKD